MLVRNCAALRRALHRNVEQLTESQLREDYDRIYHAAQRYHFELDDPRAAAHFILTMRVKRRRYSSGDDDTHCTIIDLALGLLSTDVATIQQNLLGQRYSAGHALLAAASYFCSGV